MRTLNRLVNRFLDADSPAWMIFAVTIIGLGCIQSLLADYDPKKLRLLGIVLLMPVIPLLLGYVFRRTKTGRTKAEEVFMQIVMVLTMLLLQFVLVYRNLLSTGQVVPLTLLFVSLTLQIRAVIIVFRVLKT